MVKGLLATSQFLRSTHPPILQKFSSLFSQELKTMSKTMSKTMDAAPFDQSSPKTYVFAYAGEESAKRSSQVEYFALTKDIPSGRIRCVEFTSLDDLCDQLLAVKTDTNMPIVDEFYLLVHGPGDDGSLTVCGERITGDDFKHKARDFFFKGDVPVVTPHWIHCGSALMAPNGDAIANRIFGESSKLPGSTVVITPENDSEASTWDIPYVTAAGGGGWMHTGLNPEILDNKDYRNFLLVEIKQSHPEAERVIFYGDHGNVYDDVKI